MAPYTDETPSIERIYLSAFNAGQHGRGGKLQGGTGMDLPRFRGGGGMDLPRFRGGGGGGGFQGGYGLQAFRGAYSNRQSGAGFGSVLKRIAGMALPVLLESGASAAQSFVEGRDKGKTVKESLKGAIQPTALTALQSGAKRYERKRAAQRGRGRRGKKSPKQRVYKEKKVTSRKRKLFAPKRSKTRKFDHSNF